MAENAADRAHITTASHDCERTRVLKSGDSIFYTDLVRSPTMKSWKFDNLRLPAYHAGGLAPFNGVRNSFITIYGYMFNCTCISFNGREVYLVAFSEKFKRYSKQPVTI